MVTFYIYVFILLDLFFVIDLIHLEKSLEKCMLSIQ